MIVLTAMGTGANLIRNAPSFVFPALGIDVIGLLASVGFYRWSHRSGRERLTRRLDDGMAGGSIRRAHAAIEELARLERE